MRQRAGERERGGGNIEGKKEKTHSVKERE